MSQLVLYNYYRSSTSYRVRIALELKQLSYDYRPVHLLNNGGEQNQVPYRALNPMGGVPTLVHGDKSISQSLAILQYLDDAFLQSTRLFPTDPFSKAKVLQFCEIINADMHAFGNLKVLQYLENKHAYQQSDKESWVQHWFTQGFQALEKILETSAQDFCFGTNVTAADLLLVPFVTTADRFKMDLNSFPSVTRIFKSCSQRTEFIKSHPLRQVDTPAEMRLS